MNTPSPFIKEAMQHLGFQSLNEMQQSMLTAYDAAQDMMLLSPTGSGKTLAFLLPLLSNLKKGNQNIQGVIITPTRELALQIEDVFKSMKTGFKINSCYGGHPFRLEQNNLSVPPAILVGTPGRLLDHIEKETFDTSGIHTVVLDEFDKSLEFGFQHEMKAIIQRLPSLEKKVLTSATEAKELPDFISLQSLQKINFLTAKSEKSNQLKLYSITSENDDKVPLLMQLLNSFQADENVIIFCNHREAVERLSLHLGDDYWTHDCFHGGMNQENRELVLTKLRNGSCPVIIATDLAARGLDIPAIKHIIHYQIPTTEDSFIHRNGRTARMDADGAAYILLKNEDTLPKYLHTEPIPFLVPEKRIEAPEIEWVTICLNKGKKNKINKVDVVGFLSKIGQLSREELGKIEVKDFYAYAAVKRDKVKQVMKLTKKAKIKQKNVVLTTV